MKCKTCGKNCEGEFCFIHKPRKALAKTKMLTKINKTVKNVDNKRNISDINAFFLQIWNKRKKHDCENCGKWLGSEPLSYMFDHLLEKSKYPDLKYEEDNIMLVCLECHDNKTRGFLTDLVNQKIQEIRKRYNK
jgi:5-methylcytosine-specific restriction endonuclease McrA